MLPLLLMCDFSNRLVEHLDASCQSTELRRYASFLVGTNERAALVMRYRQFLPEGCDVLLIGAGLPN